MDSNKRKPTLAIDGVSSVYLQPLEDESAVDEYPL